MITESWSNNCSFVGHKKGICVYIMNNERVANWTLGHAILLWLRSQQQMQRVFCFSSCNLFRFHPSVWPHDIWASKVGIKNKAETIGISCCGKLISAVQAFEFAPHDILFWLFHKPWKDLWICTLVEMGNPIVQQLIWWFIFPALVIAALSGSVVLINLQEKQNSTIDEWGIREWIFTCRWMIYSKKFLLPDTFDLRSMLLGQMLIAGKGSLLCTNPFVRVSLTLEAK